MCTLQQGALFLAMARKPRMSLLFLMSGLAAFICLWYCQIQNMFINHLLLEFFASIKNLDCSFCWLKSTALQSHQEKDTSFQLIKPIILIFFVVVVFALFLNGKDMEGSNRD